jgi:DNA-binding NarL/FixJ family response regulator
MTATVIPDPALLRRVIAAGLTRRELDVLEAAREGLTDSQIASRLEISVKTVHTHLNHIASKLETHSRLQAVLVVIRAGLVEL